MVISKFKEMLKSNDKRYEELYLSYTKLKLDLKNLEDKKQIEIEKFKSRLKTKVAKNLIVLFDVIENLKNTSFNIKKPDTETQRLMMDVLSVKKRLKEVMKRFDLEEFEPKEKEVNELEMDILRYEEVNGISKNKILRIIKPGVLFEGEIIKRPKIIATK
jgi:molecular chaperone GrpE (heat shock protein)